MKIDTEVAGLKTMLESHKLDTIKYLAGRTPVIATKAKNATWFPSYMLSTVDILIILQILFLWVQWCKLKMKALFNTLKCLTTLV